MVFDSIFSFTSAPDENVDVGPELGELDSGLVGLELDPALGFDCASGVGFVVGPGLDVVLDGTCVPACGLVRLALGPPLDFGAGIGSSGVSG